MKEVYLVYGVSIFNNANTIQPSLAFECLDDAIKFVDNNPPSHGFAYLYNVNPITIIRSKEWYEENEPIEGPNRNPKN